MDLKDEIKAKVKEARKKAFKDRVTIQRAGSVYYVDDGLEMTRDVAIQDVGTAAAVQSVKFYKLYKALMATPLVPEELKEGLTWLPSYRRDERLETWLTRRNDLAAYYLDRITLSFDECEELIKKEAGGLGLLSVNSLPVSKHARNNLKRLLTQKSGQQGVVYGGSDEENLTDEEREKLEETQKERDKKAKTFMEWHNKSGGK